MRRTQKNIKDADIEMFMHFNPEVALQIVNDLVDEPNLNLNNGNGVAGASISNVIDKETKTLALRIKKSPSFKFYKQHAASIVSYR